MPIVGHMPTKHDTMRKPLALLCTITMEMLLVKKVLSSQHPVRRGKCVDASCRCPTAAIGSSMRMRSFAMLMYVANTTTAKKAQSMHVDIAQHHVVHVELRRAVGTSATRSDLLGSAAAARTAVAAAEYGCALSVFVSSGRSADGFCEQGKKVITVVKTKGPGARDGERSFGRHPQQLVHDPGH